MRIREVSCLNERGMADGELVFNSSEQRTMVWDGAIWRSTLDGGSIRVEKPKKVRKAFPYLDVMGHWIGTFMIAAPIAIAVWYLFYA